jgi:hypothetical protein
MLVINFERLLEFTIPSIELLKTINTDIPFANRLIYLACVSGQSEIYRTLVSLFATKQFEDTLTRVENYSPPCSFVRLFVCSFVRSFVRLFVCSLVRLFVRAFVLSFSLAVINLSRSLPPAT